MSTTKLQEIKDALLHARKIKHKETAALLSTIVGEAEMLGKNDGNRVPTDAEVLQVLKKFEKGMLETIKFLQVAGNDNQDKINYVEKEIEIINKFMPAKLTDEEVLCDIKFIMGAHGLHYEQKSMGELTKHLKVKYQDQFDGKQVSAIFKGMLK